MIDLYFMEPEERGAKRQVLTLLRRHLVEADLRIAGLTRFRTELAGNIARLEQ